MTTAILEHKKIKMTPESEKIIVHCKRCGDAIPKRRQASWAQYKAIKYCKECGKAGMRHKPLESDVGELPISDFIGSSTQNGRLMANYYIGLLKAVDANTNGGKPKYRGVEIANDMVKAASDWLTVNWIGRAGQRKAPDDKPKRSEGELKTRLRFLVKKLFKDSANVEAVYAILDKEGL